MPCPCMDNMAKSFPLTIGSPLIKFWHRWTAKMYQHAYAETTQHAFFNIWPNNTDECRLVRFCHAESFWIKLNRFQSGCVVYSKCWIFGHMAFHTFLRDFTVPNKRWTHWVFKETCMKGKGIGKYSYEWDNPSRGVLGQKRLRVILTISW